MDGSSDVRRRKRKADDSLDDFADSTADAKGKLTTDTRRTRTASSSFTKRGSEADVRLAQISAQLPLQRGRKVAFCQPQKNDAFAGDDGEVWIMATVISCINNDTHRYIVQDAEDEGNNGPYVTAPYAAPTTPTSNLFLLYPTPSRHFQRKTTGPAPAFWRYTPTRAASTMPQSRAAAPIFRRPPPGLRYVPAALTNTRSAKPSSCKRRISSCSTTTAPTSSKCRPTWWSSTHR